MDNHRIEGHSTIFSSPHHLALISLVTASSLLTLGYLLYSWWPVAPVSGVEPSIRHQLVYGLLHAWTVGRAVIVEADEST